jgi:hypothetical protein
MILPCKGRGTMRSMVEGQVRLIRTSDLRESGACPSTSFAGPPPPVGEDWP